MALLPEAPPLVTCQDCGLLCTRDEANLNEVGVDPRRRGLTMQNEAVDLHCAVMAADLAKEIGNRSHDVVVTVLSSDRRCVKHIAWMPSLSPKEHLQMLIHERTLEKQQQWQQAESQRQREWEKQQEGETKRWQAAQSEKANKFIAKAGIAAAVVGAIVGALIGALLTALITK